VKNDVKKLIPIMLTAAKADASPGRPGSTADSLSQVGRWTDFAAKSKIEIPKETPDEWANQVNSIANQSKDELVLQAGAKTKAYLKDYVTSSVRPFPER
jgi:hypothetical protein